MIKKISRIKKMVEKKTRIKINLLDFSLLLIVLMLILGFYLFFKRENKYITVRFLVTDQQNFALNNMQYSGIVVGDTEKDEVGKAVAEIVNIEQFKINSELNFVYIDVRLKTTYNPRKSVYVYRGKQIIYNQPFTFSFTNVKLNTLVVDFPGFQNKPVEKHQIVNAQIRYESREFSDVYGIDRFLAESVNKGDVVVSSSGNVLVEVLEIDKKPARRWLYTTGGAIQISDPDLIDIKLKIRLQVFESNNDIYMFDYRPLKIGEVIPLDFKDVIVYATITEIIDEDQQQ